MALATLSIDLEARLANLQAGFDKASRLAEKSANDIEAKFNKTAAAAAGIGAAIAGAFSVGAMVQYFRATADGLDRLNDLKDATGATIENISALEDVALRTGTSFESMASSLVKFNKQLTEANAGSETANIFKRLGLDAEELRRVDPAEALRRTAVALAQFADDGSKARVVQALFGKSVQEAAPFLKDLAEAGKLNATVTTAQAQAAEDFNKQLAAFSKNALDASRAIAGPLIQALNDAAASMTNAKTSYGSLLEALSRNTGRLLSGDLTSGTLTDQLGKTVEKIKAVQALIAASEKADKPNALFAGRRDRSLREELATLQKDEQFIRQQLGGGRGSINPAFANPALSFGALPDKTGKDKAARAPKASDFAGTVLDSVTLAALDRLQDTDEQKVAALRLQLEALLELDAGAGSAATGEALRKLGEELQKIDPAAKAAAEAKNRLDKLLEATPTAKNAEVLGDIELINSAYNTGAITAEQWAEAARVVTAKIPAETAQALDKMSDQARQFQGNVQALLGDTISNTLQGNFDDIEAAWKNMLLSMLSQAIAADLSGRLFGDKSRGGTNGGLFAAFTSFLGFANGGAFGAGGNVMAFADGGVLTRATPFGMSGGRMGVAGEAGPEAVLPLKRGADGKLGVAGGGGGGVVINVAAGVNRGEVTTAIQLAMDTVKGDIFTTLRAKRVL